METTVERVSIGAWFRSAVPTKDGVVRYFSSLFPFVQWITRYNGQWFIGDLVAGATVGAVVIPQGMAYAALAQLPPEFGLYSSFMGVMVYWFFATSKDITIGPVAIMSIMVGNIVLKSKQSHPEIPAHVVASALALVVGLIILLIGLVRAGWIVEFVPLVATTAFMTGSAINIIAGQLPFLLGIRGFNAIDVPYKVIINTFANLQHTKLDAAMGISALAALYLYRFCCDLLARRMPNRSRLFFFLSTLRTALVILLYTVISFLVNHNRLNKPLFHLVGHVPSGFQHAGIPVINQKVIGTFVSELPASVVVLLIEHIAIAKSFSRINGYTVDPSQELVAIGISNILGPFLGAFPVTGSFSRTAIKSKAGVRTPLASVITAAIVLVAIYTLTGIFFYIPVATLAGVIVHAVVDLIASPATIVQFWRTSPLDLGIFVSGVIVTIFMGVENGIYTTIGMSAVILLFRILKAKGTFLSPIQDGGVEDKLANGSSRIVFVPIEYSPDPGTSSTVYTQQHGIFIYRFTEGFNYLNASHHLDELAATVLANTRQTVPKIYKKSSERPWNISRPSPAQPRENQDHLPTLKAIILDLSAVDSVDTTAVQHLVDVRKQLDSWATPDKVQWHFVSVSNPWTKRALKSVGFCRQVPGRGDLANSLSGSDCFKGSCFHANVCDAFRAATTRIEYELDVERLGGSIDIGAYP
ncbi:family sulfate permease [Fusarium beomiforme]|uniref:Family sulfate permease n=1 Tax=Fusarium beomiforme TaxID=44412 RepID=A0A9P5AAH6_9HYPO|nr:family sulfate permease [Fusarium beomiforme]